MAPTERLGAEPLAYVKLEGLGKIPFSSIRRPKPLMDVALADETPEEEEEEVAPTDDDAASQVMAPPAGCKSIHLDVHQEDIVGCYIWTV